MESNEVAKPSVMSVGLKFGLILGLVSVTIGLVQLVIGYNPMENSWVQNVINVVITVVAIVFAHKSFKDNGDGYMSYGQGLGIGMITVVVSLVIGGIYTYVYLNFLNPDALTAIWEKAEADMEAQGQSEEAIKMGLGIAKRFFWVFFIVGGLFWGCVLGLIVSIFTQKKAPETAF
jgi:hypothetical protein